MVLTLRGDRVAIALQTLAGVVLFIGAACLPTLESAIDRMLGLP